MNIPVDWFSLYSTLPPAQRKKVLRTLKYWGGWTKTSVYRKLQCPNLSPIEKVLVEGVFQCVLHEEQNKQQQLEIDFRWSEKEERIIIS